MAQADLSLRSSQAIGKMEYSYKACVELTGRTVLLLLTRGFFHLTWTSKTLQKELKQNQGLARL